MATAELHLKLEKRLQLQLQHEHNTKTVQFSRPSVASEAPSQRELSTSWSPPRPNSSAHPASESDSQSIKDRLLKAVVERDKALHHMESLEANSATQNIELGAEVARLRIDVEVLRKDLAAAREEVKKVREDGLQAHQRASDIPDLPARVQSLEEEVAQNLMDRVRLQGRLRESMLKEREARRRLHALQVRNRASQGDPAALLTSHADPAAFSINEGEVEHEKDGSAEAELRMLYEDAFEMSKLMPFDKALRLAQRNAVSSTDADQQRVPCGSEQDGPSDASGVSDAGPGVNTSPSADAGVAAGASVVADRELAYEEPLRALEFALMRLRGEALGVASGGGEMHNSHTLATPGTGEPADVNPFNAPLLELEQVLGQLGASLEHRAVDQAQPEATSAVEATRSNSDPKECKQESTLIEVARTPNCANTEQEESHKPQLSTPSFVGQDVQKTVMSMGPIGLNIMSPYARLGQRILSARSPHAIPE